MSFAFAAVRVGGALAAGNGIVRAGDAGAWCFRKAGAVALGEGLAGLHDLAPAALVLPQVASATLLLDLEADMLALDDGDPVLAWVDASANNNDFATNGNANAAYHIAYGLPYVEFTWPGSTEEDNYMVGPDMADDLASFAVFVVAAGAGSTKYPYIFSKYATAGVDTPPGWEMTGRFGLWSDDPTFTRYAEINNTTDDEGDGDLLFHTFVFVKSSATDGLFYEDGVEDHSIASNGDPVGSFTNAGPLVLGWGANSKISAALIYSPAPSEADIIAIEAYLRARYSIPTLPNVLSSTLLLNLQVSALALSDGDPVASWTDGARAFTQIGSARPTYIADDGDGSPAVSFDGIDDYLDGPDFADGLTSFAVFIIANDTNGILVLDKRDGTSHGWWMDGKTIGLAGGAGNTVTATNSDAATGSWEVVEGQVTDYSDPATYWFDDNTNSSVSTSGTVANIASTSILRIGADSTHALFFAGKLRAVMIYSPAPDATDRSAIYTWLNDRYS